MGKKIKTKKKLGLLEMHHERQIVDNDAVNRRGEAGVLEFGKESGN